MSAGVFLETPTINPMDPSLPRERGGFPLMQKYE